MPTPHPGMGPATLAYMEEGLSRLLPEVQPLQ